jgi:hypothetical protein
MTTTRKRPASVGRPRNDRRGRPAEAGPGSNVAKYLPAAKPIRARDSQPRTPNPGTADQGRMLPGPIGRTTTRVTNKNTKPRKLTATGGPQLNRPGVTGSPQARRGKLT